MNEYKYKYQIHSRLNDLFIIGQYSALGCEAIYTAKLDWVRRIFQLRPKEKYKKWVDGYHYKKVNMEDVKGMEER